MVGLDGIQNKIHPGDPADKNLYDLPPEDALVPTVCASLEEALAALKVGHEFLLRGGVFSKDWIDSYIAFKEEDVRRIRMAYTRWNLKCITACKPSGFSSNAV